MASQTCSGVAPTYTRAVTVVTLFSVTLDTRRLLLEGQMKL